jgi:predicted lipid-binding transport protein (Tim44 family)
MLRPHRTMLAFLAIVAALTFTIASVDARPSGSSGSRGGRTQSAPAATQTAPRAAPIERTMTQPAARPGSAVGQAAGQTARPGLLGGGMFGGGLLGGLAAGFIGAGLFGMLFGHGIGGGMGGFASILGLLLQIALVLIVAKLAWTWWQRRNQPAMASGPSLRDNQSAEPPHAGGFGGFGGGSAQPPADEPIEVTPADFDKFEKLLGDIQTAYGKEDLNALRVHLTPEMLSYFAEELAGNASRGVVNQISDVKLLQGDLSEAWREINDDYATVAMRYSLHDKIVDRATGRVIEEEPSEATEFWTFRRAREGDWVLSAIQQT